jgi:hypothetical protein
MYITLVKFFKKAFAALLRPSVVCPAAKQVRAKALLPPAPATKRESEGKGMEQRIGRKPAFIQGVEVGAGAEPSIIFLQHSARVRIDA